MNRLKWLSLFFLRYYRNMGLRVALYALAALALAVLGPFGARVLNDALPIDTTFDSVIPILTILASSMLAVSTFSLNVMVSAYHTAAGTTTPRVHRILLEDTTTQSVLATFIGAFVYSLSAIILYRTRFYSEDAALLVMATTIVVVVLVVLSLLRWIDHLKDLGSVDESLRLAKCRALETLEAFARDPGLGARPITDDIVSPPTVTPLPAPRSGYVQLIDIARLERCLPDGASIYITTTPGTHVAQGEPLAELSHAVDAEQQDALVASFTLGPFRTFEQDALFGLNVLAETASRALSPGINDPGTALQAISELMDVLWAYAHTERDADTPLAARVFTSVPSDLDLLTAAFLPIARDGAGTLEVARSLRGALQRLSRAEKIEIRTGARVVADRALSYSENSGLLDWELEILKRIEIGDQSHRSLTSC